MRPAGLTQAALAERSGVSTRGIQDLERNLSLHRDTVLRLAAALRLSAAQQAAFRRAAAPSPRRRVGAVEPERPVTGSRGTGVRDGVVVRPRGEGDRRFAVFPRASDAVLAAAAIQLAMYREHWPLPNALRVRVAVHTGEADLRDGDYYGTAVNRCARWRGINHAGQVLVSGATAAIVRDQLRGDVALRSLGTHALRDLFGLEQGAWQLLAAGDTRCISQVETSGVHRTR